MLCQVDRVAKAVAQSGVRCHRQLRMEMNPRQSRDCGGGGRVGTKAIYHNAIGSSFLLDLILGNSGKQATSRASLIEAMCQF